MKASECINIIEDRRFSTLVYQDGAVQTILAALRLLAATEGEEGTPETDAEFSKYTRGNIAAKHPIDIARSRERERNAALLALEEAREDAELGKILLRYIDRLMDPTPKDPLVVIVKLMSEEVMATIDAARRTK